MSAYFSSTGRPAWAITAWVDDSYVYTELPVKDGPPLIQKYAFSEAGLSKALGLMRNLHRKLSDPTVGQPQLQPHPNVKHKRTLYRGKPIEVSSEQRDMVHALLKKNGII